MCLGLTQSWRNFYTRSEGSGRRRNSLGIKRNGLTKKFSNLVKDNLNKAYFAYVKDLTASLNTNPKLFWSFVKSCTKQQSTPGCIIYYGTRAFTPEDKANVFNQFFCSVFNKRIDNLSSIPGHARDFSTVLPLHPIHDLICTPNEMAKVLKSLNVNKACGPEGISPRLLKECRMELAPSLTRLFNLCTPLSWHATDWLEDGQRSSNF